MTEFRSPARLPDPDFGSVVDAVAAGVAERLRRVRPEGAVLPAAGGQLLEPPFSTARDHFTGPPYASVTLVVFGAFGTPGSRSLGRLIDKVRDHDAADSRLAWRHFPDPAADPAAVLFALASEAAAESGHFWALTRELLRLRHHDPRALHDAIVRADLDPTAIRGSMESGIGGDRIVGDVASAVASGVAFSPALFVNGERYGRPDDHEAIDLAIDRFA